MNPTKKVQFIRNSTVCQHSKYKNADFQMNFIHTFSLQISFVPDIIIGNLSISSTPYLCFVFLKQFLSNKKRNHSRNQLNEKAKLVLQFFHKQNRHHNSKEFLIDLRLYDHKTRTSFDENSIQLEDLTHYTN